MRRSLPPAVLLSVVLSACAADVPETLHIAPETRRAAIVGGAREFDYPAVGAMVIDYQRQWGSFCTGTLIDRDWVLSAAHCFLEGEQADVEAWMVSFFVGDDARDPRNGDAFEADSFHVHPLYDPERTGYDIALVHLRDRVRNVAPQVLNAEPLHGVEGAEVFYVGFGLNDGVRETGSGLKRSGRVPIAQVGITWYATRDEGTMPCMGDSGGPGFLDMDGEGRQIGVMNSVGEDCGEGSLDTRVDAHYDWIQDTMLGGGGHDNCDLTGGDCEGQACFYVDDDVSDCLPTDGVRVGGDCDSDPESWGASLPCVDGGYCLPTSEEDPEAGRCHALCRADADCREDGFSCYKPIFRNDEELGACVEMPSECEIAAGDCDEDEACFFYQDGNFCTPSDGIGFGEECDPDPASWGEGVPCADGLLCLPVRLGSDEGSCFRLCKRDRDCPEGEVCDIPIFRDVPDVGMCGCRDEDSDGYCADEDCDDDDHRVRPGARERCDDIDNDCDGEIDEDCACTDRDGDGTCLEEDCDDLDGTIYPGADEVCGNDEDDDCDGDTDEGCPAEGEGEGGSEGEGEGGAEGEGEGGAEGEGEGGAEGEGEGGAEGEGEGGAEGEGEGGAEGEGEGGAEGEGEGGAEGEGEGGGSGGDVSGGGGGGSRRSSKAIGCTTAPAAPSSAWLLGLPLILLGRRGRLR